MNSCLSSADFDGAFVGDIWLHAFPARLDVGLETAYAAFSIPGQWLRDSAGILLPLEQLRSNQLVPPYP